MRVRVMNMTRGRELGDRVNLADWLWPRLRGLIGRPRIESGEGLMIVPCRGVHMYFMTYPIDVALMDGDGSIVALYRDLAPGARTRWHSDAHHALEVPAGTLAETSTTLGDRVVWEPRLEGRLSQDALERQGRQN
ncbi:MAG: DUF192 domain-containing protein [Gemmatimonadota bacterium]